MKWGIKIRNIWFLIIGILIFSFLGVSLVSARTISVCKSGCEYRKIQDAINVASKYDVVEVQDFNTYYENIEIYGDDITLDCGVGGMATINSLGEGYACIRIWGNDNIIKECEITGCRRGVFIIGSGVALEDRTDGNQLIDNDIHDNKVVVSGDGSGIEIRYSNSVKIINNLIKNNANDGINAEYTDLSDIEGNTLENNSGNGIYIGYSTYFANTIYNNNIEYNKKNGIKFYYVDYDYIGDGTNPNSNNILHNNEHGIYTIGSYNISILDNNIGENTKNGININGNSYDIIDNFIHDNEKGIYTTSYGHEIKDNAIWYNDYGVYIDSVHLSGYPLNEIYSNDFCYYGDSSYITDIYVYDRSSSFGDENSCQTTYRFNDTGATGCTYKCINQNCKLNISLKKGWNLISIPLNLINNSFKYLFNNTNFTVYGYKNNSWFIPNETNPKLGYWLNINKSINLALIGDEVGNKNINIAAGWNLIGYPYLEQKNIASLFNNVSVFMYNSSKWYSYKSNRSANLNTLTVLKPGFGYWVKTE